MTCASVTKFYQIFQLCYNILSSPDDAVDQQKLRLKFSKSFSGPHLNLIKLNIELYIQYEGNGLLDLFFYCNDRFTKTFQKTKSSLIG